VESGSAREGEVSVLERVASEVVDITAVGERAIFGLDIRLRKVPRHPANQH
jgi:hypothetical protein